jgi:ParB family transcriptional regulator, chromosome partitioning protein
MKSKQRLGRGIDALFSNTAVSTNSGIVDLSVSDVLPNPTQPRKIIDDDKLAELSESIKKNGLLSPILVRRNNSKFEIIAGERRFRAAILAGIEKIPSIIRDVSDGDSFRLSIVENVQREDLNPMEEAEAYYALNKHFHQTHNDIAGAVSKDRSTISNSLRLISLPEVIKESLRAGEITTGDARAILMLTGFPELISLHKTVVSKKLSVRETEKLASKNIRTKTSPKKGVASDLERLSHVLTEKLSTRVICSWTKKKGKILIEVHSREDFGRIASLLSLKEPPI